MLPVPLLIAALWALGGGQFGAVLANAVGFALFMVAAWLTRRGDLTDRPVRRFSRRTGFRLPSRNLAGALTSLATGLSAYLAAGHGPAISIAFAAVAALGYYLAYGFVPSAPRAQADTGSTDEEVNTALAEAEDRILDIEQSARAIADPELKERLGRIAAQARQILEQIAAHPQSMRRARKFLKVYLEGAQGVTRGYARTHRLAESRELEQNFRTVLATIEGVFAEQQQQLLETDVMDLDVQIEVLTKQLEREGIL